MQKNIKKKQSAPTIQAIDGVPKEVQLVWEKMKLSPYFKNPRYIAEMDYSLNSSKKRLFVYDTEKKVLHKFKAAHGVGGKNGSPHDGKCRETSNKNGSHMSCLGLFKCAEAYNGNSGPSMRLDGLDVTNSNARMRAIVVHGSDYVKDSNSSISGRSWGCPAVDHASRPVVIEMLRGGSPLYSHYNGAMRI